MLELGLLFILAGWLIQLWKVYRWNREISLRFMALYSIGVLLLAAANFQLMMPLAGWLSLAMLIPITLIVFCKR